MADYPDPAYDLDEIHEKVRVGFLHFSGDALDGAAELEFTPQEVLDCLLGLTQSDFFKSMDAERPCWKGIRQDVYKREFCGEQIYVKVQYWPSKRLFVVSFKRK